MTNSQDPDRTLHAEGGALSGSRRSRLLGDPQSGRRGVIVSIVSTLIVVGVVIGVLAAIATQMTVRVLGWYQ